MDTQTSIALAVLAIYNGATVSLLRVALRQIDLGRAVAEKAPTAQPSTMGQGAAPQPPDTSYSRVTGMIGAIVLATLFWSIGNVILWKAFTDPTKITELLHGMTSFFAGGATLFLPYAFNQAREAFALRK
jgi:hypothetical protein